MRVLSLSPLPSFLLSLTSGPCVPLADLLFGASSLVSLCCVWVHGAVLMDFFDFSLAGEVVILQASFALPCG